MINVPFSKLNNNDLFTVSLRATEIIKEHNVNELGIEIFYNSVEQKFGKYKESMNHEDSSAVANSLKDNFRDDMFIAFRNHVKNYIYHPNAELAKTAQELLNEIDKHGDKIYQQSYSTQTAKTISIINLVNKKYANFIVECNADVWFNLLVEAQNDFEASVRKTNENKVEDNEIPSVTSVRPELIKALRSLFSFMPMQYELTKNETLGKLIEQIKVEVERF